MEKSKWFKSLGAFLLVCFAVLFGTLFGAESASANTFDPNGVYKITNANSGKVLDVQYESLSNGGNIYQHTFVGKANQVWRIQPTGDGYFTITNWNSGKVAEVAGASLSNGGNIQQWDYVGGENQKWSFQPSGSGYKIVNKYSGKVMDVQNNSTADYANVHQWDNTVVNSQIWSIEQLENPLGVDPRRWYRIKEAYQGKMIDIKGNSLDNLTPAILYNYTGADNQKFRLVPSGNGAYAITAKHSNLLLTSYYNSVGGKTQVVQKNANTNLTAQQWSFHLNGGVYKMVNASTGHSVTTYTNEYLYMDPAWYVSWLIELAE